MVVTKSGAGRSRPLVPSWTKRECLHVLLVVEKGKEVLASWDRAVGPGKGTPVGGAANRLKRGHVEVQGIGSNLSVQAGRFFVHECTMKVRAKIFLN